jgi:hypothetical protein
MRADEARQLHAPRKTPMMSPQDDPTLSVSSVLQDLNAARTRLDQASGWLRDAEIIITAAALAKEVERLCHDASRCNDSCEVEPLLATARERLLELQRLLGVH